MGSEAAEGVTWMGSVWGTVLGPTRTGVVTGFVAMVGTVVEDLVRGAAEEGYTLEAGIWAWKQTTQWNEKRERNEME